MILHTLFESGIARVQDLEGYIRDDVERYGTRLTELRRKLDTAYNELVCMFFRWLNRKLSLDTVVGL